MSSFSSDKGDEICQAIWDFCKQNITFCHKLTVKGHLFITIDENVDAVVTIDESKCKNEGSILNGNTGCSCKNDDQQQWMLRRLLAGEEGSSFTSRPCTDTPKPDLSMIWRPNVTSSTKLVLDSKPHGNADHNDDAEDLPSLTTTPTNCSGRTSTSSNGSNCIILGQRSNPEVLTISDDDEIDDSPSSNVDKDSAVSDVHREEMTPSKDMTAAAYPIKLKLVNRESQKYDNMPLWEIQQPGRISDSKDAQGTCSVTKSCLERESTCSKKRIQDFEQRDSAPMEDSQGAGEPFNPSNRDDSECDMDDGKVRPPTIKRSMENETHMYSNSPEIKSNLHEKPQSATSLTSRPSELEHKRPCLEYPLQQKESEPVRGDLLGSTSAPVRNLHEKPQSATSLTSLPSELEQNRPCLEYPLQQKESEPVKGDLLGSTSAPVRDHCLNKHIEGAQRITDGQFTTSSVSSCITSSAIEVSSTGSVPFNGIAVCSCQRNTFGKKDDSKNDEGDKYTGSGSGASQPARKTSSVVTPPALPILTRGREPTVSVERDSQAQRERRNESLMRERRFHSGLPLNDEELRELHGYLGTTDTNSENVRCVERYGTINDLIIKRSDRWEQASPLEYMVLPPTGTRLVLRPADVYRYTGSPYIEQTHDTLPLDYSYLCHMCGVSLDCMQRYVYHTVREHNAYSCHTCRATFHSKAKLLHHRIVHTGLRNYECALCGKAYRHKSGCEYHLMHTHPRQVATYHLQHLYPPGYQSQPGKGNA